MASVSITIHGIHDFTVYRKFRTVGTGSDRRANWSSDHKSTVRLYAAGITFLIDRNKSIGSCACFIENWLVLAVLWPRGNISGHAQCNWHEDTDKQVWSPIILLVSNVDRKSLRWVFIIPDSARRFQQNSDWTRYNPLILESVNYEFITIKFKHYYN